ncbi:MAG: sorbosone dehydrogenase family protein, partial [Acidobacteria bacterium]|nr:sorbosone dehydrogenase family protein [Acidobacteriota bacterium]
MNRKDVVVSTLPLLLFLGITLVISACAKAFEQGNSSPFYDYRAENPGTVRQITVKDLPSPFATKSANNSPIPASRPEGAIPQTLPGFKASLFVTGLDEPRELRTAPNGDVFLAESSKGEIKILRGVTRDGKPEQTSTFASGLNRPFGIAFYPPDHPQWVYVADTDAVKRFPYHPGGLEAGGPAQTIIAEIFPGASQARGHWTRDVVFSPDGKKMYVAVGSGSNIDDPDTHQTEFHRA